MPAAVTRRLADLGIFVFRSYGSTEHPSITGSTLDAPEDKRLLTDGNPMPGVEIRLADDGEILSRGPDLCLGYTDDALTAAAFDDDGWYHTGDVGVLDDDGYLTITDRKADVIIRGGENISALEVEEVLLAMPGVPRPWWWPRLTPASASAPPPCCGSSPGTRCRARGQVRAHFAGQGVARQKWPEVIARSRRLSAHASGKVQKRLVRRGLRERHCGSL